MNKFEKAVDQIEQKNAQDPNKEVHNGKEIPKELLYAERMSQKLLEFEPNASEEIQIAARAQHICRWKLPRKDYPMNRAGYLKWREELKKIHAGITEKILQDVGYSKDFVNRVSFLIKKKGIKKDEESQTMEDVVCLVFLEYHFEDFANKHKNDKVIDIIKKTWRKMSAKGHEAALKLPLSPKSLSLIKAALA